MTYPRVLSLLGRWHQWRRAYTHERGFASAEHARAAHDMEDDLEALLMNAIEAEIEGLPREDQLALQHVARAECMGVEVLFNPRLGNAATRSTAIERALIRIEKRLLHIGVL